MSVERLEKGDEINDRWILCHPQDIVVNGRSLKVKHTCLMLRVGLTHWKHCDNLAQCWQVEIHFNINRLSGIIQNRRLNTQHNNCFLPIPLRDRLEVVLAPYRLSSQAIISPLFSQ